MKIEKEPLPTYKELRSYENLELAFNKAKKRKTLQPYVIKFEKQLQQNLLQLRNELRAHIYKPKPLTTFILREPKTRKISKSHFRDRIIHHAICNIIELVFEKQFIHDSYANRIGKGTFNAIKRFDKFKRKASKNNKKICFVLKADIKQYFETVDHKILLSIIKKTIKDKKIIWLIKLIISNHNTIKKGKGMPLGNLTSQFFANVYLNELDQYVKHELKSKYYIRYVDDFVIFHTSRKKLENFKQKINIFLQQKLKLKLHHDKSKVIKLHKGINFLGFRIFFHHKLMRKNNIQKFERKLNRLRNLYQQNEIDREKIIEKFEGWLAYTKHANTYKYRKKLTSKFNQYFPPEQTNKKINIKKHEKINEEIETSQYQYSKLKTLQLFKKQLSIKQIAQQRSIKESTVWEHLAKLIEYNQCALKKVLPKEKINKILPYIYSENDKLKDIKSRIKDETLTFDEINCVLAHIKCKSKKKNIYQLTKWYQQNNCNRKCYFEKTQRQKCKEKFNTFISQNPNLQMKQKEFLNLFNEHLKICILPDKEKRNYIPWVA